MSIDKIMNRREHRQNVSIRPGQLSVRRQRIERWAYKDRNISNNDKAMRSSALLGTSLIEKRSESSFIQAGRRLNMDLYQLGQQREKLLERNNFEQKLFANKQALRHKENEDFQRTLNYVRKCCRYSEKDDDHEGEFNDSTIVLNRSRSMKTNRSRSLAPTQPTVKQNKFLRSDQNEKYQIPFRMNTKRNSQSAHVSSRSRSMNEQRTRSTHGVRITNSAPARTTIYYRKEPIKPKRPSPRIFASKKSLEQFRRYPERYLSQSNRYLPLLRRRAIDSELKSKKQPIQSNARFLEGSEYTFDDVRSFLSEENETEKLNVDSHLPTWDKHDRRSTSKLRAPTKLNFMETMVDNTSERTLAIARLRDREYAHLQELIRSNSIKHILEPLSSIKSSKNEQRNLDKILHSNDSFRYSKTTTTNKHKKQSMDIEKNLSKFGILIF